MTIDAGRFTWFEQLSQDTSAAARFYTEALPLHTEAMMIAGTTYTLLKAKDQSVGGLGTLPDGMKTPHWISYVSVQDVGATARAIVANGGRTLMDAFDIPGVGKMQPVADPQGAAFFLFRAATTDNPEPKGEGSFHWNELWATDAKAAVDFYCKVFGYTSTSMDMPTGTYYVLHNGDKQRGGIMTASVPNMPAHWLPYLAVADVDATIAQVKRNKGSAEGDAMEVPGIGRYAFVRDAQGARLGIITPAAK